MNKRFLIILALVIALAALAGIYFFIIKKPATQTSNVTIQKKQVDLSEIPSSFPKDLPEKAGSKVLRNFQVTMPDGRLQSTRVVTTSSSSSVALKTYGEYFTAHDWQIIQGNDKDSDASSLTLRHMSDLLLIKTGVDPATSENTIELSLTESKK